MSAVLDRGERWCLVGAGPGGLCAARWLAALDVPFDGFEAQQDVGGIWDISFPGSPMYESCHFISSRTLSGFRDHPMPASYEPVRRMANYVSARPYKRHLSRLLQPLR